jgi:hypothetical protein
MKYKKGNRDDIGKAEKEHIVNVRKHHFYIWVTIFHIISIPKCIVMIHVSSITITIA